MKYPKVFMELLEEAFEYQKEQTLKQLESQTATAEDPQQVQQLAEALAALEKMTITKWTVDLLMPVVQQLLTAKVRAEIQGELDGKKEAAEG